MNISPSLNTQQKKILILTSLGGVLEYYDFIIYIFLTPFLEKIFFSADSTYIATLKTLAIFSAGYLVRPFGGVLFSHFGDTRGRKVVFLLTVLFMAVPSFAIGLLPGVDQIGIAAPLILLGLRMMQGLALGGEIPAAITFVAEHVPQRRLGISMAVLFFGINLGLLSGSLITTVLTSNFSESEILAYAWRYPFLIGGVFGILSIYLRRYLQETAAFRALMQEDKKQVPLISVIKESTSQIFQGFFMVAIGSVTVFLYLYWPQYLHQYMNYNLAEVMRLNTLGTLVLSVTIIFGGMLGDQFGYRKIFLLCCIILSVLTYPLFTLFQLGSIEWVKFVYIIFSIIFGMIPSSYSAMLSQLFPTATRYTGIAMSYNLSYALFGGLSPIICTFAIHQFSSNLAPAFFIIGVSMLAGIACYPRKSKENPVMLQDTLL